jgi:hypothetical protein
MTINKRTRVLGAAALFACSPLAVMAQTTGPTTPSTPDRPSATEPARPADPAMKPTEPAARPALPRTTQQTAPKVNPLIGLAVFSSDGSKLGNVHSVNAEPDGKVKAIHLKTWWLPWHRRQAGRHPRGQVQPRRRQHPARHDVRRSEQASGGQGAELTSSSMSPDLNAAGRPRAARLHVGPCPGLDTILLQVWRKQRAQGTVALMGTIIRL